MESTNYKLDFNYFEKVFDSYFVRNFEHYFDNMVDFDNSMHLENNHTIMKNYIVHYEHMNCHYNYY
jgi:hypothetical protein